MTLRTYLGTYDPGVGVPGTCVQVPNYRAVLIWAMVQAFAVACGSSGHAVERMIAGGRRRTRT